LDLLLAAFADVCQKQPHVRWLLAGEGTLRPELEKLTAQLDVSHAVRWVGFYHDIPRFLSAIDIFVQTSVNEGMSLSILEAMAARKPVIATRVGGNEEIISDNINGVLIPSLSSRAVSTALIELINQPQQLSFLAENALESIRNEYHINKMAESYSRVYNNMINGKMRNL
jgi:glycosyltransferase involved in cell wall biosynthesis